MGSRASPSSSSDVDDDIIEELGPVRKKRRISGEALMLSRARVIESDSSEFISPGTSRNSSVTSRGSSATTACTTYRTSSYLAPARAMKGSSSGVSAAPAARSSGGVSAASVSRCRGGSTDKDNKMVSVVRNGSKNLGSGSSGRSMKEQWLVHGTEQNRIREQRVGVEDQQARWREDQIRPVEDQITSSQGAEPAEVASLQARLQQREDELSAQRRENDRFLTELQESVECPVCFSIPRKPPVPCCQNGHIVCSRCKDKLETCPTCRVPMTNCVSQVAATIIQRIQHPCYFKDAGCVFRCNINSIEEHEKNCIFRGVRCPHWACDEMISLTGLTSHVIRRECGDNYMDKPLPYEEEIEYTRALDDQDGSSFWRPSLLMLHEITFYLQIEKSGKDRQWYFYVQMEGSEAECEKYASQITVCKNSNSQLNSIAYCGKVCPIDIKGADELDTEACGLNVRDAVMEKIFTVDNTGQDGGKESARSHASGEKEEGEVGDQAEEGEGDRYKFWVKVDIFKVEN